MSNNMTTPRWQLLSTVSALALIGSAYAADAAGSDADRPVLWIELGAQMENVSGQGEIFAPAFLAANPHSPVLQSVTPLQAQKPPRFGFGEEGKISYQPEGSDWMFSAAIRIGRSGNQRKVDHQTNRTFSKYPGYTTDLENFANTKAGRSESHAVLDFSAGKDVGLGIFGGDGSSTLNLGVRFAQFTSKSTFDIHARPDLRLHYKYMSYAGIHFLPIHYFHTYYATGSSSRSFHGVGPSISWNGSVPFAGNRQDGEIMFDWGANAALLFGKQRARVQHQESGHYNGGGGLAHAYYTLVYQHPSSGHPAHGHDNLHSVTVPNVGGSVGLSWRAENFKISVGYRADMFFGAMDTGIDAVKKSNMTFNGPYASISIGLGD
jgi:iron complex outermembrane recepter protein